MLHKDAYFHFIFPIKSTNSSRHKQDYQLHGFFLKPELKQMLKAAWTGLFSS